MVYKDEYLKELIFPVGGIGTGSIGITGAGLLRDFEIFNRPSKRSVNGFTHFAVRVETADGRIYTKVVCADETENLTGIYHQRHAHSHGYGYGLPSVSMNGFPHFQKVSVNCRYPVADYTFEDDGFPGKVVMKAWNPLIPHDSFNSSLPAAFFTLEYFGETDAKVSFAFSFRSPFHDSLNEAVEAADHTGVVFSSTEDKESIEYGDIALLCADRTATVQTDWYRGGWCDDIVTFWNEFSADRFTDRHFDFPRQNHASVICHAAKAEFVLAWNIPNCENYWNPPEEGKKQWKNWYATQFRNATESGTYCIRNRASLYAKTADYCEAMFSQTLPEKIVEAAANTLSVLRSPTVLRLEDGSFYGFEGAGEDGGSCEGTCQHVWNYAYALCFLFPELERSIRDTEFRYAMLESGETRFRVGLPLGREPASWLPCFDGQMGCVIKTYREWKISGDDAWLKKNWNSVKKVLDFARSPENAFQWDADADGYAEGRMHHTLDMELFGASGWLQGMYLAALKAAAEMARYLGEDQKAAEYIALFDSGKRLTGEKLFNGEWFVQDIDLHDRSVLEKFDCVNTYWNREKNEIKYQIGGGCEIDQLLGQWHAAVCGIGDVFDTQQAKKAAYSIYRHNFKKSMREFTNPWRLFAVNDEPGTVICTYPDEKNKPLIPIPYCEECMNGFEYAFAGTLIAEGYVEEGIEVASAVRAKYNGKNRNPFNEIECGSNYARSMASFALIVLLSGFEFDIPNGYVGFSPKINGESFRCFWSVGNAYGIYEQTKTAATLSVLSGTLTLRCFSALQAEQIKKLCADGQELAFTARENRLYFEEQNITSHLTVSV